MNQTKIFHTINAGSDKARPANTMNVGNKKKLLRIAIAACFIILLLASAGYFANKYFGFLKQTITIHNPLSSKDAQEKTDGSTSQNGILSIPAQVLTAPTAKFTIDVKPQGLESITARLKFKSGPKEIKLGVRGNAKDKFIYRPFYQMLIQENNWDKIEEYGSILFQRNKTYDSLKKLIENPPDSSKFASYYINRSLIMNEMVKTGSGGTSKPIKFETGLRGTHTFIVRVDRAPFSFKLSKQDMNMYAGEDKYLISVSLDGRQIEEKSIPDDGFLGTEKLKKEPQSVEFNIYDIEPGIYEVLAKAEGTGGDARITSIETNQSKMVIVSQVFTLFDKPMTIYTGYSPVTLRAVHDGFEQTVQLDGNIPLNLENAKKDYVFDLKQLDPEKKPGELYRLETPKTDVLFKSAGYFSLSAEQYFNPDVIHVTDLNAIASLDDIDYIFTSTPKARSEGDWLVAEVTFDAKSIKIDDKQKLYFSLEIPEIEQYGGKLEIDAFDVDVNIPGILTQAFGREGPEKPEAGEVTSLLSRVKSAPNKIGGYFSDRYQQIKSFVVGSFNKIFRKGGGQSDSEAQVKSPVPENTPTPSPTPTKTPSPTPTPTPMPAEINKTIKIEVLNAGAPDGYATKYADLIKNAGYENVEASDAEKEDMQDAEMTYPKKFENDAGRIEKILLKEYKTVRKNTDDGKTDITITLGAI